MTAENSTKKLRTEKSKREEETALVIKTILQLVIMAAVAVLFLSGSYLTYSDSTVTIPMTGIDVLTSLFYGGEVGFVNYGKILYVSIPWYAIGAGLLIVLAAVVFAVWTAISGFAGKKDAAAVGIAQMAFGGLLLLFYILCLVGKFMAATSASGEKLPFYKLYEIRPLFLLTACLFVFAGGVAYGCKLGQIPAVKRFFPFYVILIVPTLLILVFNVYPSILQTILAFKEYYLGSGVWGSEWAGLSNFKFIFSDARMQMVIWQTVYLSFLRLLAGIIPAVLFALVFYHITSKKYRSVVQTIVYIPHFFSWVVIYAIISAFLTPNGVVNNIIVGVFGGEPIDFLSKPELFYTNMILSSIWKEAGWGSILFMASLMGIDKALYEAASIDGAGAMKKLWHITLPGLIPILVYQVVMSVGNLLKGAGGEQILLFSTNAVQNNKALVIDTWLYWEGMNPRLYGLSGAISFVQAVIGFVMVIGAHKLSQRLVGIGAL